MKLFNIYELGSVLKIAETGMGEELIKWISSRSRHFQLQLLEETTF